MNTPAETTIVETITALLQRRGADNLVVRPESQLTADLGMDSLELAELSATLEDELGSDPYATDAVLDTVGDLIAFFNQ